MFLFFIDDGRDDLRLLCLLFFRRLGEQQPVDPLDRFIDAHALQLFADLAGVHREHFIVLGALHHAVYIKAFAAFQRPYEVAQHRHQYGGLVGENIGVHRLVPLIGPAAGLLHGIAEARKVCKIRRRQRNAEVAPLAELRKQVRDLGHLKVGKLRRQQLAHPELRNERFDRMEQVFNTLLRHVGGQEIRHIRQDPAQHVHRRFDQPVQQRRDGGQDIGQNGVRFGVSFVCRIRFDAVGRGADTLQQRDHRRLISVGAGNDDPVKQRIIALCKQQPQHRRKGAQQRCHGGGKTGLIAVCKAP